MHEAQQKVAQFMATFGQPVSNNPGLPGGNLQAALAKIDQDGDFGNIEALREGADEFLDALKKVSVQLKELGLEGEALRVMRIRLLWEEVFEYTEAELNDDLVKIADGLGDIAVITAGTNATYGIPGGHVFDEIHESNMSKLGPDGLPIYDETGKILKGPGYRRPDLFAVLSGYAKGHLKDRPTYEQVVITLGKMAYGCSPNDELWAKEDQQVVEFVQSHGRTPAEQCKCGCGFPCTQTWKAVPGTGEPMESAAPGTTISGAESVNDHHGV